MKVFFKQNNENGIKFEIKTSNELDKHGHYITTAKLTFYRVKQKINGVFACKNFVKLKAFDESYIGEELLEITAHINCIENEIDLYLNSNAELRSEQLDNWLNMGGHSYLKSCLKEFNLTFYDSSRISFNYKFINVTVYDVVLKKENNVIYNIKMPKENIFRNGLYLGKIKLVRHFLLILNNTDKVLQQKLGKYLYFDNVYLSNELLKKLNLNTISEKIDFDFYINDEQDDTIVHFLNKHIVGGTNDIDMKQYIATKYNVQGIYLEGVLFKRYIEQQYLIDVQKDILGDIRNTYAKLVLMTNREIDAYYIQVGLNNKILTVNSYILWYCTSNSNWTKIKEVVVNE